MAAPLNVNSGMAMILQHSKLCCRGIPIKQIQRHKSGRSRGNISRGVRNVEKTYDTIIKSHQEVADRSFLVGYGGNIPQLYQTCNKHGPVQAVYPYVSGPRKYALVQMGNRSSVDSIISNSRQFDNPDKIPMRSRFLYQPEHGGDNTRQRRSYPAGVIKNTQTETDSRALYTSLLRCKSPSDQMRQLCEAMSVSEFALRIRFFLGSALGETLRGTLPGCSISPFGSTVNGFGRNGGDLDMLLETDMYTEPQQYMQKDGFLFLTKKKQENSRFQVQMTLETVGGIISHFIPQFGFVRRILKARVPIIRFTSNSTNIECDLSINNRSALYMSELLHLYSRLDDRVRPLVFTIRHWARINDVTQSKTGMYISNFMLTWMVISFLQTKKDPLVPLIRVLKEYAGPGDERSLNGEDITFVRDWTKVPPSQNQQNLDELLLEFFHFFSSFDFKQNALSLHHGIFTKPISGESESDFLYIENPIEKEFNAAKIVPDSELNKFQEACRTARKKLENSLAMRPGRTPWGVMSILVENGGIDERPKLVVGDIFAETSPMDDKPKQINQAWADMSMPISGSFNDQNATKNSGSEDDTIPDIENKDS